MSDEQARKLDKNVLYFDKKSVRRIIIKFFRELAKENKTNQFDISISAVDSLFLLANSLFCFIEEKGLLEKYIEDIKKKYPEDFAGCIELYNVLGEITLDKANIIF